MTITQTKPLRGFAALKARDPQRLWELCSRGGRTAQEKGTSYRLTSEKASEIGKLGVAARRLKREQATQKGEQA